MGESVDPSEPSDDRSDDHEVRAFYEAEAARRTRTAPVADRAEFRSAFIGQLTAEGRRRVLGLGSGPGFDGAEFLERGFDFVGIDLAIGNAKRASEIGVTVLAASITALPLRPDAFDAGWCMSTLMHLTDEATEEALAAMAAVLREGSPLWIGVWGGDGSVLIDDTTIEGERRPYELRTMARNRELIEASFDIEEAAQHDLGPEGQHYQLFRLRRR